jgi:hypothetical protein
VNQHKQRSCTADFVFYLAFLHRTDEFSNTVYLVYLCGRLKRFELSISMQDRAQHVAILASLALTVSG